MRYVTSCISIIISLGMGTAKANETLDTLTKVGGAFFQDPAIKQTILTGLNTSRTKFIAACTVDHTTWTSSAFPVILPPYPNGGVYPVPDIVSAMAINEFAFHIAWSAGNQRDDIVAYYVDDSGNCTTLASQTFDNATPEWPDRIGPRMGNHA